MGAWIEYSSLTNKVLEYIQRQTQEEVIVNENTNYINNIKKSTNS